MERPNSFAHHYCQRQSRNHNCCLQKRQSPYVLPPRSRPKTFPRHTITFCCLQINPQPRKIGSGDHLWTLVYLDIGDSASASASYSHQRKRSVIISSLGWSCCQIIDTATNYNRDWSRTFVYSWSWHRLLAQFDRYIKCNSVMFKLQLPFGQFATRGRKGFAFGKLELFGTIIQIQTYFSLRHWRTHKIIGNVDALS